MPGRPDRPSFNSAVVMWALGRSLRRRPQRERSVPVFAQLMILGVTNALLLNQDALLGLPEGREWSPERGFRFLTMGIAAALAVTGDGGRRTDVFYVWMTFAYLTHGIATAMFLAHLWGASFSHVILGACYSVGLWGMLFIE